jgi:hypothetical protein
MHLALIIKIIRRAGVKVTQILRPIRTVPVEVVCFKCGTLIETQYWPEGTTAKYSHGVCPKCLRLF